ncbi:odorant receptor 10a-like [Ochlerotatus camptorhynchus]|uniref:odorant receptor 10a-like n=1 Tax=Ochlerotatus camptorhynchus TaxID=644619 RepID=UPI0031D7A838
MPRKLIAFADGDVQYRPFQLQKKLFRGLGYYPGDERFAHWGMFLVLFFHYWSQVMLIYWEGKHAWIKIGEGDLQPAFEGICPTPSRFGGLLKCCILISKRKQLKQLLDTLKELFDRKEPREKEVNLWATYWGYQFTYWELMFTHLTCVFYCLLPIAAMLLHFMTEPDESRIYILPFKLALPFDYCKSPVFEITYIIMCYIAYPPIFMMAGGDGLFIGVCLLISSQYRIVQQELEALGESGGGKDSFAQATDEENDRIFEQLKLIAQRHNRTIGITVEMSALFLQNVFASFTIAAIKIGLACITVMNAEGLNKLIFVWYSLGIITEIYVYSYGGTRLMEESEKLSQTAYDFPWYRYRKNVRQIIQMMMLRAQKPSRVDVPFFEASVVTFSTILRTAGSYVALMQTFL